MHRKFITPNIAAQKLEKMKRNPINWLIASVVILLGGNFGLSQGLKENKLPIRLTSDDSVWIESNRNIEIRKDGGVGFFYPYNLPDADNGALALFRTYTTPINTGFTIIELDSSIENPKSLSGRIKFSGSDIDQTQDTLLIATYYSKTENQLVLANLNEGLIPENADVVKISDPLAQFESFHMNLSEPNNEEDRKYLIIQLILKSGSDDNYYYGRSNAVIDNLHLNN